MDIRKFDRTAVLETVRILQRATPDDWESPTPCAGWTLRRLVGHMAGQHHGFAASAGGGDDLAAWHPLDLGDDPLPVYRAAALAAIDAFAPPEVLTRMFSLPEISTADRFPASVAIGFHFLDYVVHGWDVARTLGLPFEPSEEIADAALVIALRVPDDERRLGSDPLFRPSLATAPGAGSLDLALTALGRNPGWSAPAHS
ncbi:TIGR03086 family metal-binding protein [Streptomyces sp. NPDC006649]|uniref:TIGR03086 family metal-binding protein n=1 Tax=Streptomyces sp. NPDC006649 TaxID=3156896 RepID=UPI0033B69B34